MREEQSATTESPAAPAGRTTAAAPPPAQAPVPADWGPAKRILFRFAFVYLLLWALPFPLNQTLPFADLPQPVKSVAAVAAQLSQGYSDLWHGPVVWVGQNVFGTSNLAPNANHDTIYHYVQTFCRLVLSVVVAAVWTVLARNRSGYPLLHHGLRAYLRLALAVWLISYASLKVFKIQFADPSPSRLLQPVGEMSPMRLMWTFMGVSEGYSAFTGLGELLAGLLLTCRRTTLLGALLAVAIMAHVFVLNLCYDVPVKLFSCHLLLVAVFLTLPDLPRLANLFLLGRPAAAIAVPRFLPPRWDRAGAIARTALVLGFAGLLLADSYETRRTTGDLRPRPPLYGAWFVEEFVLAGETRPPLTTDAERWQWLIVEDARWVSVRFMDRTRVTYPQTHDPDARTLNLTRFDDPSWKADLACEQPGPDVLILEGRLAGKPIRVRCRRAEESRFLLINRGFHWINERPFVP
jgi:hypothetical protein